MQSDVNFIQPGDLKDLGWSPFFQEHLQTLNIPGSEPARVISESRDSFQVFCRYGELTARVSGKMRNPNETDKLFPAVGDWVVIKPLPDEQKGIIQAVLPRRSKFSRKAAGERTAEQIVAANIDTVFIVSGLDGGRSFNLRRIERYLTLAWNSGATPVIVLNKMDLCPDVDQYLQSVEEIATGISIHAVSARKRTGLEMLRSYLTKGSTTAFLGSSGVGKSALINCLLGAEKQETGAVREDDHTGRHTTTRRELFILPEGGIVIDTPGMREIQMWAGEEDLQGAFQDIETLAKECRFRDCTHNVEKGCAVKEALNQGKLEASRLESYLKLQKEVNYLAAREEQGARQYEKMHWKKIAKWQKELQNRP